MGIRRDPLSLKIVVTRCQASPRTTRHSEAPAAGVHRNLGHAVSRIALLNELPFGPRALNTASFSHVLDSLHDLALHSRPLPWHQLCILQLSDKIRWLPPACTRASRDRDTRNTPTED